MDVTVSVERQPDSAGGPPPDPARFFDAVLDVFQQASAGRLIEHRYRIGGKAVLMRFAGAALAERFSPAIGHLSDESPADKKPAERNNDEPDLTVHFFDDRSTGARMPPAPWPPEAHGQRGVIRGYNDNRFFTTYEIGIDILQMFDAKRNAGLRRHRGDRAHDGQDRRRDGGAARCHRRRAHGLRHVQSRRPRHAHRAGAPDAQIRRQVRRVGAWAISSHDALALPIYITTA